MGFILREPVLGKYYWIISDPHNDIPFVSPIKVKFLEQKFLQEDNRQLVGIGSYFITSIFENNIRIPIHDSGLKTGYKQTIGYYVSESSAHIIQVMTRIAYPEKFDLPTVDDFDYNWFRNLLSDLEKNHPELMI